MVLLLHDNDGVEIPFDVVFGAAPPKLNPSCDTNPGAPRSGVCCISVSFGCCQGTALNMSASLDQVLFRMPGSGTGAKTPFLRCPSARVPRDDMACLESLGMPNLCSSVCVIAGSDSGGCSQGCCCCCSGCCCGCCCGCCQGCCQGCCWWLDGPSSSHSSVVLDGSSHTSIPLNGKVLWSVNLQSPASKAVFCRSKPV